MLPPPPSVFSRAPAEHRLDVCRVERDEHGGIGQQPTLVLRRHRQRGAVGIEDVSDVIEEKASWSTRYRTASNFAGGWAGEAEGTLYRLRLPKGNRAVKEARRYIHST